MYVSTQTEVESNKKSHSQLPRIPTQPRQILSQKHLPLQYLRARLAQFLPYIDRSRVRRCLRLEGSRCDVVLEEFLVDDVDDGRDQLFDVLCACSECIDVIY